MKGYWLFMTVLSIMSYVATQHIMYFMLINISLGIMLGLMFND